MSDDQRRDYHAVVQRAYQRRIAGVIETPAELLARCGLLPEEMGQTWAAARDIPEQRRVYAELRDWDGTGRGWYLWGDTRDQRNPGGNGTGKSYALAALTIDLCARGIECLLWNGAALLESVKAGMDDGVDRQLLSRCQRVPVLCLDDLGKGAHRDASDWAGGVLYDIIDARARRRLPVVVASNLLLPDGIVQRYGTKHGPAIASRLDGACRVRILGGTDLRRK